MLASKQAGLKQRVKHIHWTNTLELRTHFSQFSSTFGSDHLLVVERVTVLLGVAMEGTGISIHF